MFHSDSSDTALFGEISSIQNENAHNLAKLMYHNDSDMSVNRPGSDMSLNDHCDVQSVIYLIAHVACSDVFWIFQFVQMGQL